LDSSASRRSGGGPYVLALGALVPERVRRVAIVSGAGMLDRPRAMEESPGELATELGEEAQALREDPEGSFAEFSAELPEVDRQMLERPDVRALFIEMFQEGVRQDATGWIDDNLRFAQPWPFRLDEIRVEVRFRHGEDNILAPPHHAKKLVERIPGNRLRLYPGEGHLSIDRHIKEIAETLLAP
jgi:pimeloyl-ACP methyl ester carboxylesterase